MNPITLKPHTQYLPQEEFGVVYLVWIHQPTRIGYLTSSLWACANRCGYVEHAGHMSFLVTAPLARSRDFIS